MPFNHGMSQLEFLKYCNGLRSQVAALQQEVASKGWSESLRERHAVLTTEIAAADISWTAAQITQLILDRIDNRMANNG